MRFCDSSRLRLATPCRMCALRLGAQASRMNCFRGPTFRELFMVARTETPNASLPWLVRITAIAQTCSTPRRGLPSTLHWGGQRVILATISTHSGGDGMVLHLADKTSASTTSAANSMLAMSENIACNGCAGKWQPRSVLQCIGVRMAASSWPTQSYTQKTSEQLPPRQGCWGDV